MATNKRVCGVELIAEERERRAAAHPDGGDGRTGLIDAAVLYAFAARWATFTNMPQPMSSGYRDAHGAWPWPEDEWDPDVDPVKNLTLAGALIAEEIDRLTAAHTGNDGFDD